MNTATRTRKAFLLRRFSLAILGSFLASGCRSTTDLNADALPIVLFDGGLSGQLVLMSEDGTVRRELLDLPEGFAEYPRWSPDGRQIAFTRLSSNPQGPGGLFIINVDGSGLRQISHPDGVFGADWSPDGTRLVVYSGNGIAVVGQDGTGLTPLPATNRSRGASGWGISWSPDGNEILYNGDHDVAGGTAGPDVWVFNLVTGVSRMLATPGLDARWSPDGRRIAYIATSGIGDLGSLVVIDSDGSNPRTLVPRGSGGPGWPEFSWSPDGTRLLYAGELAPCGCRELYTISVDGGESTNITRNTAGRFTRRPDWYRPR